MEKSRFIIARRWFLLLFGDSVVAGPASYNIEYDFLFDFI